VILTKSFFCEKCRETFDDKWLVECNVRCGKCGTLYETDWDQDPESYFDVIVWTTNEVKEQA
jgi:hypothetical protein